MSCECRRTLDPSSSKSGGVFGGVAVSTSSVRRRFEVCVNDVRHIGRDAGMSAATTAIGCPTQRTLACTSTGRSAPFRSAQPRIAREPATSAIRRLQTHQSLQPEPVAASRFSKRNRVAGRPTHYSHVERTARRYVAWILPLALNERTVLTSEQCHPISPPTTTPYLCALEHMAELTRGEGRWSGEYLDGLVWPKYSAAIHALVRVRTAGGAR
jgi:hypothetical protein